MAKRPARQFACRACGAVYPKWMGQCEACGEWNTLEEIAVEPLAASSPRASSKGRRVKLEGLEGMAAPPPVAAALISAATGMPTSAGEVYFGEVGLSGEVRQVSQADARLKEAAKLGFDKAVLPRRIARGSARTKPPEGLTLREIGHVADLVTADMEAD